MAEKAGVQARAQESKQKCSNSCKQNASYSSSGSSADRVLHLQKTAGNQAVQRLIKSRAFQAKLSIGQSNDIYEQEADRVAEQVMRMPGPVIQRRCPRCTVDEKKILQAKQSPGQLPVIQSRDLPPVVHEVLRSPGQPLDMGIREFMEPRFGYDFSRIKIHTNATAMESATAINALAYTVGNNIIFGKGQYRPNSMAGKKLVAHELSHAVQQAGSSELSRASISSSLSGDILESKTNNMFENIVSDAAVRRQGASVNLAQSSNVLQRQPADCPSKAVEEREHAGLCPEIKRESGELEKFKPSIEESTPAKCYLLKNFGSSSANFSNLPELDKIADIFSKDSSATMYIEGYTDCIRRDNNPSLNEELRRRRAESIRDYFVNVKKLDGSRISTAAAPSYRYIDPNNSPEGRARNRSVVIRITATPIEHKYRCINGVCTQDDVNGIFTESTCKGTCTPVPPLAFVCGPDIDAQLTKVLSNMQAHFRALGGWKKHWSCQWLITPPMAIMAWDIHQLFLPETDWLRLPPFSPPCGRPPAPIGGDIEDPKTCSNSVRVGGKCNLAGTANYATFGVMMRECYDYYSGSPALWTWKANIPFFTETGMKSFIGLYKTVTFDDRVPPTEFAVATYYGGPTGRPATENRKHCSTACKASATPPAFTFVWEPYKER